MIKLESYRSVYGLVAKYFRDPKLRMVFSFHPLLVGGNPFTASSMYCLITFLEKHWGVHFAMGGTGKLVEGLVKLIHGQGNDASATIRTSARSSSRTAPPRGVRLADRRGDQRRHRGVERRLRPRPIAICCRPSARSRWTDRKIEKSRYSMSLFLWYFGTKQAVHRRQAPHHHARAALQGTDHRHLHAQGTAPTISACICIARPRPIRRWRLPGCDTFYVLSPVPHLESGIDWHTKAESYRKLIAKELSDTILPDLENQVVTSRMLTPQDFQDRLSSFRGAAFGLEPVLTQSAWFRPHNQSEDVENLYLVGAGTHPGAGLPGVLSSARVLDSLVPDAHSLGEVMTSQSDLAACREMLKEGSRTFHAASLVLPQRISRSGDRALCVLPRRRRRGRSRHSTAPPRSKC